MLGWIQAAMQQNTITEEAFVLQSLQIKASKNQNDFIKASFLPKTNKTILRISALLYFGQFCLGLSRSSKW